MKKVDFFLDTWKGFCLLILSVILTILGVAAVVDYLQHKDDYSIAREDIIAVIGYHNHGYKVILHDGQFVEFSEKYASIDGFPTADSIVVTPLSEKVDMTLAEGNDDVKRTFRINDIAFLSYGGWTHAYDMIVYAKGAGVMRLEYYRDANQLSEAIRNSLDGTITLYRKGNKWTLCSF